MTIPRPIGRARSDGPVAQRQSPLPSFGGESGGDCRPPHVWAPAVSASGAGETAPGGARGTVRLTMGWPPPPDRKVLRWTLDDFRRFRNLALAHRADGDLEANAFQAFRIFRAKNFDLFLDLDLSGVVAELNAIKNVMAELERFERTGEAGGSELVETYLAVRRVVARPTASDERRALWILLFSGPSTARELADDLGRSEELASRILRALDPVVECSDTEDAGVERHRILDTPDALGVTLFLLRSTLGVDILDAMIEEAARD